MYTTNNSSISNNKKKYQNQGIFAGILGLILNLLLGISKLFVGIIYNSSAIIGDAANNISDSVSNAITVVIFCLSGKKEDKEHPFGHGRYEYLAALIIGVLILFTGWQFAVTGYKRISNPLEVQIEFLGVIILVISIALKIFLMINYKVNAKKSNSSTLNAAAIDSFFDILTTLVVLVSLLISPYLPFQIDGYCTIFVAVVIMWGGIRVINQATGKLIGDRTNPELIQKIYSLVLENDSITGAHDLIIHDYGPNKKIGTIHAEFDKDLKISQAHGIIDLIESTVLRLYGTELCVHVDFIDQSNPATNQLRSQINEILSQYDNTTFHELIINDKEKIIAFDIKLTDKYELFKDIIYNNIKEKICENFHGYTVIINFDVLYCDN